MQWTVIRVQVWCQHLNVWHWNAKQQAQFTTLWKLPCNMANAKLNQFLPELTRRLKIPITYLAVNSLLKHADTWTAMISLLKFQIKTYNRNISSTDLHHFKPMFIMFMFIKYKMMKIKRTHSVPSWINVNTAFDSQPCSGVTKWTHTRAIAHSVHSTMKSIFSHLCSSGSSSVPFPL